MYYKPKENLLENRIILITGASGGIGREAALTYARYGANVILLGRNKNKLRAVAQEIINEGSKAVRWFVFDMLTSTYINYKFLKLRISSYYSRLDGLLNNAALLGEICPMEKQNPKIWKKVMQVNINGTFFLTKSLLPLLLKSNSSSLIFTSSNVGRYGRANWGAYSVSKFATEGMMQVLAEEYKSSKNLRVNCINPGRVRTKMRALAFPEENPQELKTPSDIMPLYLWLMSEDSQFKNGITFYAQPNRKCQSNKNHIIQRT